jgi:hypothetical protein
LYKEISTFFFHSSDELAIFSFYDSSYFLPDNTIKILLIVVRLLICSWVFFLNFDLCSTKHFPSSFFLSDGLEQRADHKLNFYRRQVVSRSSRKIKLDVTKTHALFFGEFFSG